jgi:glycosyltransferase involved in cell wall biosynthesis
MSGTVDYCTVCFYCADQNPSRDRSRGITYYTKDLLTHLCGSVSLKALVSRSSFQVPESIEQIRLPFRTDHLAGRLAADHFHPLIVGSQGADIWHYPKGFLPFGPQVRAKKVGTIADLMLQYEADVYPALRSNLEFTYWIGLLKHSLQHLDLVITMSEFSKRAIIEFCLRHKVKQPPIIVTFTAVTVLKQESESRRKEDYVVHLASKIFYKGTRWLLEQWVALRRAGRELPPLKLVGDLDCDAQRLYSQIPDVTLIAPLSRNELSKLIAKARALLVPSEIEGFGRAVVEAYMLGTPAVYTKGTALEEVLGAGSPGGFERERESLYAALNEVLKLDDNFIRRKAEWLERQYSCDNCASRTLEAYRTLL